MKEFDAKDIQNQDRAINITYDEYTRITLMIINFMKN